MLLRARVLPRTRAERRRAGQLLHAVPSSSAPPSASLAARLAFTGALVGPPLDCIHGAAGVLTYDVLPFTLFGLHSAATVPPLLAVLYASLGLATVWADARAGSPAPAQPASAPPWRAFAGCTSLLAASAVLYAADAAPGCELAVLSGLCFALWAWLDRTPQGAALALATACAPAAELVLMNGAGLWHYPRGAVSFGLERGFPLWVPACYFAYSLWVSALARYFNAQEAQRV